MIERLPIKLNSDKNRVILQFLDVGEVRSKVLIEKIQAIPNSNCIELLNENINDFEYRHKNYKEKLLKNYNRICEKLKLNINISETRKLLIGAYFSKEYSIEAAALFNPSIVIHHDQTNLNENQTRFILSLRATGEGHISSIEFREGIINGNNEIELSKISRCVSLPNYDNKTNSNDCSYDCEFDESSNISERVLFPYSKQESVGMEDARFVKFDNNRGSKYYGTYTAYNGRKFRTQIIVTENFRKFNIRQLSGKAIKDKGMALFPKIIDGKYFMIGRQDGFNIHLMSSDNLYHWDTSSILKSPKHPWDLIQLGNCGSPIETDAGWLVITHAVGAVRKYVISAILLDIDDPSKIIGELDEPLIEPNDEEREGYVPNVVYTCGSIVHKNNLIIPYAMSDSACGFARIDTKALLAKMIN